MFARGVGGEDGFPCERFLAGYTPQVHRQRVKVEHAVGLDGRKGGSIPLQLPRAKVGKQLDLDCRVLRPADWSRRSRRSALRPARPGTTTSRLTESHSIWRSRAIRSGWVEMSVASRSLQQLSFAAGTTKERSGDLIFESAKTLPRSVSHRRSEPPTTLSVSVPSQPLALAKRAAHTRRSPRHATSGPNQT